MKPAPLSVGIVLFSFALASVPSPQVASPIAPGLAFVARQPVAIRLGTTSYTRARKQRVALQMQKSSASSVKKWQPTVGYDPKKRPAGAAQGVDPEAEAPISQMAKAEDAGQVLQAKVVSADSKARSPSSKWQPYVGYDPQTRAVPASVASEPNSREAPDKCIIKVEVDRSPTPMVAKTEEDTSRASSAAISILGSVPVKKWQPNEGYDPRKRPSGAAPSKFEPSRSQQAGKAEAPATTAGLAEDDGPGLVRVLVVRKEAEDAVRDATQVLARMKALEPEAGSAEVDKAALQDTQDSNARAPWSEWQTSGGYEDAQKRAAPLPLPPLSPVSPSPFSPLFLPTQTMHTQMASEEVSVSEKGVSVARAARRMRRGTWTADAKQEYMDALDSINQKVVDRLCEAQDTSAPFVKELLVDTEGKPPSVLDKSSASDARKKEEMSATAAAAALKKVLEDRKNEDEKVGKSVKETLSRQLAKERRQRGVAAAKQKENIKDQSSRNGNPPQLASNALTPKLSLPRQADKNRLPTATDKESGIQKKFELDTPKSKVQGLENLKKALEQDLKEIEKQLADLKPATPATARGNATGITTPPDPAITTVQPLDNTSPADMFSFSKLFQVR